MIAALDANGRTFSQAINTQFKELVSTELVALKVRAGPLIGHLVSEPAHFDPLGGPARTMDRLVEADSVHTSRSETCRDRHRVWADDFAVDLGAEAHTKLEYNIDPVKAQSAFGAAETAPSTTRTSLGDLAPPAGLHAAVASRACGPTGSCCIAAIACRQLANS